PMFSRRLSLLSLAGFLLAQVCSGGLIRRDIIGYDDRDALFDRWDKSTFSHPMKATRFARSRTLGVSLIKKDDHNNGQLLIIFIAAIVENTLLIDGGEARMLHKGKTNLSDTHMTSSMSGA